MSAAVLQSCAAGPTAPKSVGGSGRASSEYASTRNPVAASRPGRRPWWRPAPAGCSTRSASTSAQVPPRSRADQLAEQRHAEVGVVEAAARWAAPARPGPGRRAARRRPGARRVSQTSPYGSRCRPAVCDSSRRTVSSPCAGTSRCRPIGSSRSSRPSSRHCMTSTAVNVLVTEPIRNRVSGAQRGVVAGRADRAASRAGGRRGAGPPTARAPGPRPGPSGPSAPAVVDRRVTRGHRAQHRAQRRAAEHVRVHVEDLLAAVRAGVEHQPEAVAEQPLGLGHRGGRGQHLAGQRRVALGERRHVGVVLLRDHQHVHRRLRVDVAEGERGGGLPDDRWPGSPRRRCGRTGSRCPSGT